MKYLSLILRVTRFRELLFVRLLLFFVFVITPEYSVWFGVYPHKWKLQLLDRLLPVCWFYRE